MSAPGAGRVAYARSISHRRTPTTNQNSATALVAQWIEQPLLRARSQVRPGGAGHRGTSAFDAGGPQGEVAGGRVFLPRWRATRA